MIKTGLESTAYFGFEDYADGLKKLKSHGYDCVDYRGLMSPDSPLYKMDDEAFRAYLTKVAEAAEAAGVEIRQLHGLWPTDDTTAESRAKNFRFYVKELEAAHYLRCKHVVIHPLLPYGWAAEGNEEEIRRLNVELFSALMPYAESYGVIVCVENLPFKNTEASSRVAEIKRLIRTVNSPYLKVCLDTGHANVYPEDIGDDVRLLAEDLTVLHVHDNFGRRDEHHMPYRGTICWEKFLTALKEIGYKGCFTLETGISVAVPEPIREEMRLSLSKLARMMADKIEE